MAKKNGCGLQDEHGDGFDSDLDPAFRGLSSFDAVGAGGTLVAPSFSPCAFSTTGYQKFRVSGVVGMDGRKRREGTRRKEPRRLSSFRSILSTDL